MKIVLKIESSHSTREDERDLAAELVKAQLTKKPKETCPDHPNGCYKEKDYEPSDEV